MYLIALSALALSDETLTLTGWISDSKCGAQMTGYCAKACITAGEKPVFVTEHKQVMAIVNTDRTSGFEGEHVTLRGSLNAGKLSINSIERAKPH